MGKRERLSSEEKGRLEDLEEKGYRYGVFDKKKGTKVVFIRRKGLRGKMFPYELTVIFGKGPRWGDPLQIAYREAYECYYLSLKAEFLRALNINQRKLASAAFKFLSS